MLSKLLFARKKLFEKLQKVSICFRCDFLSQEVILGSYKKFEEEQ